jgi:tetratricopeptide (TPR) repeat protein
MVLLTLLFSLGLSLHTKAVPQGDVRQRMEMAQRLLAAGRVEAAAREFQKILVTDPDNIEARVDLGVLAYFHRDCGLAAPNLRQALSRQPSLFKAQALLAFCEKQQGDLDRATRDLEQSLPHLRDPKLTKLVTIQLVEIYYQRGNLDRAAHLVAELQRAQPTDIDALFMEYRIHTELAERARDTLALVAPDSARMHQLMAEQFVNEGDVANAIAQYEKALAKDPEIPGVHYELGEAMMQNSTSSNSLERAAREFNAALAENPKNPGAHAKLGKIAWLQGNVAQSEQEYRRALVLQPDQADALKGMAEIYNRRGQMQRAIEYLLRASQSAPLDESIYYQLGYIYRKLGRTREARQALTRFEELRNLKRQSSLTQQRSGQGFHDASAP